MKKINDESNKIIDYKTRQLLFFQCHLKLIKQIFIKNNEKFNETNANYLLNKYINKYRKLKCIAYFLIDRIRLKRYKNLIYIKPFRKEIIYRDIKHFFIFPNYPQLFMLCIIDEYNNNKKSYELYQCINYNDVSVVCNLTYKASINIYNTLYNTISLKEINLTNNDYSKYKLKYSSFNNLLNQTNNNLNLFKSSKQMNNSMIKNNSNSNLFINYSNDYSINNNNNNEKCLIKKELIKNTLNSVYSNNLQSYHPKFYSLHNLDSNKAEYINSKMHIIKNNVHSDYSVRKLSLIPHNNNNNNNEQQEIYIKDNQLFKQKSLNVTYSPLPSPSSSSPSSTTTTRTSNEDYNLDKYIHINQDIFSTNDHMNSKFQDIKRNSIFLKQNLSQPLNYNNNVKMLKTFTIPTGNKVYCHKNDLDIYHDNMNMKMNDYRLFNDYDDDDNNYYYFENKLRKCKSNIDITSADTTYLCYDPVVGIRINNKGPIYMYMARYNSTLISSSHDCVDLETY
ncbi:unnamed protein product [Schistosoma spindalis]|nr:unnamed protein product [Schistosoma spindale]